MAELKRCPECSGFATVIHMYDTYDRADFGWDAGCGRYRAGDGLHTKEMKVSGLPSKEKAIEAWNRRITIMSELKPCPFCGGEVEERGGSCNYGKHTMTLDIKCGECGTIFKFKSNWKLNPIPEAIEAWNRRSQCQ